MTESDFERYLKKLKLRESDLRGKRLVDCGCGYGAFVKTCLDIGLTDSVYGIDEYLETMPGYEDHFKTGDFFDPLPWDKLDYIFFVRSLFYDCFNEKQFAKLIGQLLERLKPAGEIRISPVEHLVGNSTSREVICAIVGVLDSYPCNYTLTPLPTPSERRTEKLLIIGRI